MFSLDSPGQEPGLDRERAELDAAETQRRTRADRKRFGARELFDRTRQSLRGDRQARESLRRERDAEDEGLRVERETSDHARSEERSLSDARLAREKQSRSDDDDERRTTVDREARSTRDLEEVLALVEAQIVVVTARLSAVLKTVPRGIFEGELSESVGTIRTATDRMRQLVEDALDPGDTRSRYHDEGGSG